MRYATYVCSASINIRIINIKFCNAIYLLNIIHKDIAFECQRDLVLSEFYRIKGRGSLPTLSIHVIYNCVDSIISNILCIIKR